jgi:hypothetical protein
VWCLDFDNAAALALIRHENQAAQRASKTDNGDGDLMAEPMMQPTPELIPGKPFVTVVQT